MKLILASFVAFSVMGMAPAFGCDCAVKKCEDGAKTDADKKACASQKSAKCGCKKGHESEACGCKLKKGADPEKKG